MRKNLVSFISSLLILFILGSCSDYNKVVKGDDYNEKLRVANEYFEKGMQPKKRRFSDKPKLNANGEQKLNTNSLLQSVTLYEQIYQRMPKTGEGELAYFRIGKAYYHAEDYYMAGYYMGSFTQRFPMSVKCQEALFLSAMCSVKNSPEFSLDQNETELAINDLQQFINRYPNSELVDSCNHIMDRLRFKLERKDYEAVKLYAKTEDYRAAVASAMSFLENHPRSSFREEVSFILVKNSYMLTKNSVDAKKRERIEQTIERCNTFVSEFPDSKYRESVVETQVEMEREL
jgi:outer membrane protein assembly factor BamD